MYFSCKSILLYSTKIFLTAVFSFPSDALSQQPTLWAFCSYYGYHPYPNGEYTNAIACADSYVNSNPGYSYNLDGHPWPYNGGHIRVYLCPAGTIHSRHGNKCVPEVFSLVVPDETPPPPHCAGNPVNTATGGKLQREQDIPPTAPGYVELVRYYYVNESGQGSWKFNYQRSLHVVNSARMRSPNPAQRAGTSDVSRTYDTKANACLLGWDEVRSRLSESWAQSATAELVGDTCRISQGGRIVRNLSVIRNTTSTPPVRLVRLVRENGAVIAYQKEGSSWAPLGATNGKLESVNSGNVVWRYTSSDGQVEEYDVAGKLIFITSRSGIRQELLYDSADLLSQVQDSAGGQLQFSYANSRLSSVTTTDNQVTEYSYNQDGLLIDVQRPDSTHRLYHYENTTFLTLLTGITDERAVRYATWAYDAQGRAISSEHADGKNKTLLSFNSNGSTTVTNPLGKQTTYHFEYTAGASRLVEVEGHATASCEAANQYYTYTPEGWVASKTDWNGNVTSYSYNSLGQEISRTEAVGTPQEHTVTTEWHLSLPLVTRVVDAGRETVHTYDNDGRLLNTTVNPLSAP